MLGGWLNLIEAKYMFAMKHILLLALVLLLSGSACKKERPEVSGTEPARVLVYANTRGYRHECIEPGSKALERYFAPHNIALTISEDSAWFTPAKLAGFDAIMFFQTTGDVLNADQQQAFESFIRSGKGFVGVHAAADTEYDWPWYGRLVGAYFADHPDIQNGVVVVSDTAHASCRHLPARWTRYDEWYNFRALPVNVNVLLTVDEDTYQGGAHGVRHPVSWYHVVHGGRSFYTAMGHTVESYADTLFLRHILEGTRWAIGGDQADIRNSGE